MGPPGFHTTAREPKRAHLSVPALQTPPKFHEKTPRERRMNEISGGKEKKKSEILGGPEGVPAEGVRGRGPKILNTPITHNKHQPSTNKHQQAPPSTTNRHQQQHQQAPTGTNRQQQAPTGTNRHQQETTGNNRKQPGTTKNNQEKEEQQQQKIWPKH